LVKNIDKKNRLVQGFKMKEYTTQGEITHALTMEIKIAQ
jgi:hypothetical protein